MIDPVEITSEVLRLHSEIAHRGSQEHVSAASTHMKQTINSLNNASSARLLAMRHENSSGYSPTEDARFMQNLSGSYNSHMKAANFHLEAIRKIHQETQQLPSIAPVRPSFEARTLPTPVPDPVKRRVPQSGLTPEQRARAGLSTQHPLEESLAREFPSPPARTGEFHGGAGLKVIRNTEPIESPRARGHLRLVQD